MSEINKHQEYTRDQIVAALSEFSDRGDGDPENLDSSDPRVVQADNAFVDWANQERSRAKDIGTLEAELSANLSISTVYIDAGFANLDYLDEVVNNWLVQDIQTAIDAGLTEMAEKIRQKRQGYSFKLRRLSS